MNANQVSQPPELDPETLSLPDNASLFTRLRVATQILKVIRGNEGNPTYGQVLNACLDLEVYAALVQQLQRSEEGRRMLSERPSLQGKELDLGALERLPEGTLGHEFARYFRDNKISPFETTLELKKDIDFIGKRYRETHDLLHMLTGYGTDVVGEMELQAWVLGNLGIRTAVLILLVGTLGQLKTQGPAVRRRAVRVPAAVVGRVPRWPRVPAVPRLLVRAPLGDPRGHVARAAVRPRGTDELTPPG